MNSGLVKFPRKIKLTFPSSGFDSETVLLSIWTDVPHELRKETTSTGDDWMLLFMVNVIIQNKYRGFSIFKVKRKK